MALGHGCKRSRPPARPLHRLGPRSHSGPRALTIAALANTVEKILLAAPRGYCAGVDRAVQTVERALALHGPRCTCARRSSTTSTSCEQLRERGAIFVEQETEVPEGAVTVFSAHGVAPSVHANAQARGLRTIDATCPLVTKVHVEARRFAEQGYTIVLVGHAGHEEVEGTMGEAPEQIVLVENEQRRRRAARCRTPSASPTSPRPRSRWTRPAAIVARLRERFPSIVGPAHG